MAVDYWISGPSQHGVSLGRPRQLELSDIVTTRHDVRFHHRGTANGLPKYYMRLSDTSMVTVPFEKFPSSSANQ